MYLQNKKNRAITEDVAISVGIINSVFSNLKNSWTSVLCTRGTSRKD